MRELNQKEIEQVAGSAYTGMNGSTASLTSVEKCLPFFNDVLTWVNNLFGTKFPLFKL